MDVPKPPPFPQSQPEQKSGRAIASLILAIGSIVLCLGPLLGIPAVILGHLAQSDIRKSAGRLHGSGLATAGLVIGYFSFVFIFIVGCMAAIAIPNLVKARDSAQRQACRNNMSAIQAGKEQWAQEQLKPVDAVPADEDLFGDSRFIRYKPQCPRGGTYSLNSVEERPDCSIHGVLP